MRVCYSRGVDPKLRRRLEELEQGLLSAGGVPIDVAQRTQTWLQSTARMINAELGRPAPPRPPSNAPPSRAAEAPPGPTPAPAPGPTDAARSRRAAIAQSNDVAWLCAMAR